MLSAVMTSGVCRFNFFVPPIDAARLRMLIFAALLSRFVRSAA
jgi:hypothetical protein